MKIKFNSFKSPFWVNKFNVFLLFAGLFINIIIWGILFFKFKPNEYPIALHYNIYFGIDFIDVWYKIYLLSFIGLIFILFNSIISIFLYNYQEKLASYFLLCTSLFIQILLLIAVINILFI